MEAITGIFIIWLLWSTVAGLHRFYHQKIRDKVAHDVLDNEFYYTKEKEEILSANINLGLIKANNLKLENTTFSVLSCPSCTGRLVQRKSKYGVFVGCSNYPRCNVIIKKTK